MLNLEKKKCKNIFLHPIFIMDFGTKNYKELIMIIIRINSHNSHFLLPFIKKSLNLKDLALNLMFLS